MRRRHLLRFTFLVTLLSVRCFSSSEGRTMPLSLCSSWHTAEGSAHSSRNRPSFFLSPSLFSFDKAQTCVCDCPCVHACVWTCKQKWGSYIRGVWLIAGQFLKKLKCGHAPHVAAQRGFRFKTRAGNSTCLLSSLNLISCNYQMCTTCQIKRVLNGTIFAFSLITSGL